MTRIMTGIGFYGQPHQINKMLAKVLVRFDRVPLAIQPEGMQGDAWAAGHGRRSCAGRRPFNATKARAAMPREAKMIGFFLMMSEGRAELHIRIRGARTGDEQSTGR